MKRYDRGADGGNMEQRGLTFIDILFGNMGHRVVDFYIKTRLIKSDKFKDMMKEKLLLGHFFLGRILYWSMKLGKCWKTAKLPKYIKSSKSLPYFINFQLLFPFKHNAINSGCM